MYQIWSMFYCSIVSMRLHPGYGINPSSSMLSECAQIADEMCKELVARWPELESSICQSESH